ncbi:DUF1801 domain-containing protein [Arthrobacter sp. LAPM80]|uniref:DUF1801 domain-containing protein n=1 Tax=Arthrobacter sp. LAPM80 TaxID=3141788 RepID=UPI00398B99EE
MGNASDAGKATKTSNKTVPTRVDPLDFISTVDITSTRRGDARALVEMMREITGEEPRMWGPSIIGFGEYHYKYASGREGDAAAVGFSPRKANLVVYGLTYPQDAAPLLETLGKVKTGTACIYINKLTDVDQDVLRQLIDMAYRHFTTADIQSLQSKKQKD